MATSRTPVIYAAPYVITGLPESAPIRDGAVAFDSEARVLAVGAEADVLSAVPKAELRRERAILFPGLVNAHVHLELSGLRGHTQSGGGFGPWLSGMMTKRAQLRPEEDAEAIDSAVSELLRSGTVALGEVTNSLAGVDSLRSAPILTRVFHEVFGMTRAGADANIVGMRTAAAALNLPAHMRYALAPHTLYSLHPAVAKALVDEAAARGEVTSLHLAEHAAERAFLRDRTGSFAAFLSARGIPKADWDVPGLSPTAYAEKLAVLAPHVLAVHLCDTTREELHAIAASGVQAVLCPRSNLFIELKLPPLHDILDAGFLPALGTDSLASNTTLDVLAEAAALRDRFPTVDPARIFAMATWYGARALGLDARVGALKVGLSPGLLALDFAEIPPDPFKLLLRAPPLPRRVLLRAALPLAPASFTSAH